MGIKQVYTIGGNVCTLGGYAMGPTALPDPKIKTMYIATESAICSASASAYVNGSFVTSWTASNGSASASAMVGPYQDVVVVMETNRPYSYSSTVSTTGYLTSAPSYTTSGTVIVSGTSRYTGDDSPIMSAKYRGGRMIISGNGRMFDPMNWVASYRYTHRPLMLPNSVSSSPIAGLAYKKSADVTSWDERYSGYQYMFNISAFDSFRVSATVNTNVTATGSHDHVSYYLRQTNSNPQFTGFHEIAYRGIDESTSTTFVMSGNGKVVSSLSYYNQPYFWAIGHQSGSANIYADVWVFSGVLK